MAQRHENARALGYGDGYEGRPKDKVGFRWSAIRWIYNEFYEQGRRAYRQMIEESRPKCPKCGEKLYPISGAVEGKMLVACMRCKDVETIGVE